MYYALTFTIGVVFGAIALFVYLVGWHAAMKKQQQVAMGEAKQGREALSAAAKRESDVRRLMDELAKRRSEFESRIVSYGELQQENRVLKRDLQNIDLNIGKLELDGELRDNKQRDLDERSNLLAKRYLDESVKSVVAAVGPNNFVACKQRLLDVIRRCREIGFAVTADEESKLLADLRAEFEREVKAEIAREEQRRIREQLRQEAQLQKEIERERQQADRERAAIQVALERAMAEAQGQHTAEIEQLKTKLAEAEERSKRALSMAQQTRAGHVYVISNIETLGKDVFKVGMTRRLDPQERVDELSSASVPFPYDVHMMISCDDAPSLENALHRGLISCRINRANPRKEFFKVTLDEICEIVKKNHGEVHYVAEPEALEYHQSISMSDEDAKMIESAYEAAGKDDAIVHDVD
jgi:hypothetical protein